MQRSFTSGSRQAPDPFDQYLEDHGFYRKHTARDASSLFRTISEQLYDHQLHHATIRQECVNYMRKYKDTFQPYIDRDIDEYLDDLSKPKTFATLLELEALGFLYKRNILLFQAFNTGSWTVFNADYEGIFRIFHTPEKHFDSVFPIDYIQDAAFCQSICYEILYKNVFKLPDITFAVEQMLYSKSFEFENVQSEYKGGYCTCIHLEDGRKFEFDPPENTCCILENYQLCHFHNPDFPRFTENVHNELSIINNMEKDEKSLNKTVDSFLPDKYVSCVRQLLMEGITPFPYKVAKALDPDMYRNIEFDAWNEIRKEAKIRNWYNGGNSLQVGVKCNVKLRSSQNDLYTCYIQQMSGEKGQCLVYIEELARKQLVPYEFLKPLPADQAKPWPLPVRLQKHFENCNGYKHVRAFRHYRGKLHNYNEYYMPAIKSCDYIDDDPKKEVFYNLQQYSTLQNFPAQSMEYCTMPFTVEQDRDNNRCNSDSVSNSQKLDIEPKQDDYDDEESVEISAGSYSYAGNTHTYHYTHYDNSIIQATPQSVMQPNANPYYYTTGYPSYQNPFIQGPPIANQTQISYLPSYCPITSGGGGQNSNRYVPTTAPTGRINYEAKRSVLPSGEDLPNDVLTLQYFYNLGVDTYKNKRVIKNESTVENKDAVARITSDIQNLQTDEESNSERKSDSNNNHSDNNYNNNNPSNNNHQRKFQPRYFNNRKNYRGGGNNMHQNQNRYSSSSNEYGRSVKSNNMGTSDINKTRNTVTATVSDQAIQTSPTSLTVTTSDGSESVQTTVMCYPSPIPTPYGQSTMYSSENEQQQPPTSGGVYVQGPYMQVPPPPAANYGICPIPPPMAANSASNGYNTYMGGHPIHPQQFSTSLHHPPTQMQMSSTSYQTNEPAPVAYLGSDCPVDNNQYAYISCAHSISCPHSGYVYYSPTNAGVGVPPRPPFLPQAPGPIAAAGNLVAPQGYWCLPPPPISSPTGTVNQNNGSSNAQG